MKLLEKLRSLRNKNDTAVENTHTHLYADADIAAYGVGSTIAQHIDGIDLLNLANVNTALLSI